jgi:hypothetical protein
MCKNADNTCPGCKKHASADRDWMFFTGLMTRTDLLIAAPNNRIMARHAPGQEAVHLIKPVRRFKTALPNSARHKRRGELKL